MVIDEAEVETTKTSKWAKWARAKVGPCGLSGVGTSCREGRHQICIGEQLHESKWSSQLRHTKGVRPGRKSNVEADLLSADLRNALRWWQKFLDG